MALKMYRSRYGDSIVSEVFNRACHEEGVQVAVQPPIPTNGYKPTLLIKNLNEKEYIAVYHNIEDLMGNKTAVTTRIMPGESSTIQLPDNEALEDIKIRRINGGLDES